MKTLKKLPFILAFALAAFAGACSDIELTPTRTDEKDNPIVKPPPAPPVAPGNTVAPDSVTLG